jgi:hypothetical protein
MKQPSIDNALAPIEFILSVAGSLMILILLLFVPATLFGSGSFLGLGEGDAVCVTAPVTAMTGTSGAEMDRLRSLGSGNMLKPGTQAKATSVELCDPSPSGVQHLWSVLDRLSPLAYAFGFVACAWLLTRTARRHGLFSPDVALRTGHLGLYVLLGGLLVSLTRMWSGNQLMLSMATTHRTGTWWYFLHFSWAVLFAGFGLLTVGRVMAQSVRMQREIDATV